MTSSTDRRTARGLPARLARPVLLGCFLALGLPLAAPAQAQQGQSFRDNFARDDFTGALRSEMAGRAGSELRPFYAVRGWQPLWLEADGSVRQAALTLLDQVEGAEMDGLNPRRLKAQDLAKALDRARSGDPQALARLELTASRVYAGWVAALRGADHAPMIYESEALAPVVPTTMASLQAAAASASLEDHMAKMAWMHPLYAPLRAALFERGYSDVQRRQLALNLDRVRAMPALGAGRYVLVDAAGARLWMYENGKPVDSMKVVVGKSDNQTPMMAGFLRYAILNPYWNVPDDLVAGRIAHNVLDKGPAYLKAGGYEVLDGWDDSAPLVDPATVDWSSVASGLSQVRVRQLPGRSNFMGRVKFMFPNAQGIYLHDTPDKALMRKDKRTASSGCVRLEDAARLGRWLLEKPMPRQVSEAEKRLELPAPVPVYITYLTAFPSMKPGSSAIVFRADPYGRDGGITQMASGGPVSDTAR